MDGKEFKCEQGLEGFESAGGYEWLMNEQGDITKTIGLKGAVADVYNTCCKEAEIEADFCWVFLPLLPVNEK